VNIAELCNEFPNVGSYVLDLRLMPLEKIVWREEALEAALKIKDRVSQSVHLSNLGLAYLELGNVHKAIEYYESRLVIAQEIR
jgi:tetratricopeptide (TPR) repeat protein